MTPRLLFVVNVDWFFLSHRLPIALEALKQGYEVHIATGLTNREDELRSYGFIVHALDLKRGRANFINYFKTFYQILKVYKSVQPDLVHLITIKPVLLGGLAARFTRVPGVVAAISGLGSVFVDRGVKAQVRRFLVKLFYTISLHHKRLVVIFQNPSDKAVLKKVIGLSEQQTKLIRGSGVDLSVYKKRPLPSGRPVVLMAARFLHDKGILEFVEAARYLNTSQEASSQSPRFVLVGSPDRDNPTSVTEHELDQWIEQGIIEYWGHRTDMPEVLAQAHIVVLPSYYGEGLPKILIEAAACGRAVITTDHPGCRDAILEDVTGLLVPVRNAEALAETIQTLLDAPQRVLDMGEAGRAFAEDRYDVRSVVGEHIGVYGELRGGGL